MYVCMYMYIYIHIYIYPFPFPQTWAKVNKDFGSIFSTLLPGTNAKLEYICNIYVYK